VGRKHSIQPSLTPHDDEFWKVYTGGNLELNPHCFLELAQLRNFSDATITA
jgi:hypothetical protein